MTVYIGEQDVPAGYYYFDYYDTKQRAMEQVKYHEKQGYLVKVRHNRLSGRYTLYRKETK